ncbi:MAG: hypothetical protein WC740_16925 [Verrucomicrobiia bacterium]
MSQPPPKVTDSNWNSETALEELLEELDELLGWLELDEDEELLLELEE